MVKPLANVVSLDALPPTAAKRVEYLVGRRSCSASMSLTPYSFSSTVEQQRAFGLAKNGSIAVKQALFARLLDAPLVYSCGAACLWCPIASQSSTKERDEADAVRRSQIMSRGFLISTKTRAVYPHMGSNLGCLPPFTLLLASSSL